MGDAYEMKRRVREKLEAGFHCLKFKIGGIDFEDELSIIKSVREEFSAESLEIRLDANGADLLHVAHGQYAVNHAQ